MNAVETIVWPLHESRDLRNPDRGASAVAGACRFEDVARSELLSGPDARKADYRRWRAVFPDGEVKITQVIVSGPCSVVEFVNRGSQTGRLESSLCTFPPSRRGTEGRYCRVMRAQGGKVVEGRDDDDSASTDQRRGLVT